MLVVGAAVGLGFAISGAIPVDTATVWRAAHAPTYYGTSWAADLDSRYVYPPVLAQVVGLLPLDWPAFVVVWQTLVFAGLWAALREWTLPVFAVSATAAALDGFAGPLANPVTLLLVGNIQAIVVASVVVGLRQPAAVVSDRRRSPRVSALSGSPPAASGDPSPWRSP